MRPPRSMHSRAGGSPWAWGWAGTRRSLGLGDKRARTGRLTDEALEAMGRLWAGGPATYEGRYYSFADATLGTYPATKGGPPILVGGYSDAALRNCFENPNGLHYEVP